MGNQVQCAVAVELEPRDPEFVLSTLRLASQREYVGLGSCDPVTRDFPDDRLFPQFTSFLVFVLRPLPDIAPRLQHFPKGLALGLGQLCSFIHGFGNIPGSQALPFKAIRTLRRLRGRERHDLAPKDNEVRRPIRQGGHSCSCKAALGSPSLAGSGIDYGNERRPISNGLPTLAGSFGYPQNIFEMEIESCFNSLYEPLGVPTTFWVPGSIDCGSKAMPQARICSDVWKYLRQHGF